ncbi:MAG: Helix-turn-helix domain [Clostridia bacterium]|jgi:transcriptional regulator with XRE-family HTH domain|nr:Helix-turn-helix domain [Clostridia bacterium]
MKLRLKEVREIRGWSQGKLAIYSGVARHHISELESGYYMPKADTICKLCRALGCTPNDLIDCECEDREP